MTKDFEEDLKKEIRRLNAKTTTSNKKAFVLVVSGGVGAFVIFHLGKFANKMVRNRKTK